MSTLFTSIVVLTGVALVFGLLLGLAAVKLAVKSNPIVDQIDAMLPQTQCGQCGYPGCKPYAQAIAKGDAINKCPPGGDETAVKLAEFMGVEAKPVAAAPEKLIKKVAFIREDECIGCTKCIQACPVDAIVGARKLMHTVITKDCTGCDLCVAPCPVDCIDMLPIKKTVQNWSWDLAIPIKTIEDSR
jgi:Na+-translocating ferredoxin:NAD+ oxidoreductase subunit B